MFVCRHCNRSFRKSNGLTSHMKNNKDCLFKQRLMEMHKADVLQQELEAGARLFHTNDDAESFPGRDPPSIAPGAFYVDVGICDNAQELADEVSEDEIGQASGNQQPDEDGDALPFGNNDAESISCHLTHPAPSLASPPIINLNDTSAGGEKSSSSKPNLTDGPNDRSVLDGLSSADRIGTRAPPRDLTNSWLYVRRGHASTALSEDATGVEVDDDGIPPAIGDDITVDHSVNDCFPDWKLINVVPDLFPDHGLSNTISPEELTSKVPPTQIMTDMELAMRNGYYISDKSSITPPEKAKLELLLLLEMANVPHYVFPMVLGWLEKLNKDNVVSVNYPAEMFSQKKRRDFIKSILQHKKFPEFDSIPIALESKKTQSVLHGKQWFENLDAAKAKAYFQVIDSHLKDNNRFAADHRTSAIVHLFDLEQQIIDLLTTKHLVGNLDNLVVNRSQLPDSAFQPYESDATKPMKEALDGSWYRDTVRRLHLKENEFLLPIKIYLDKTGTTAMLRHGLEPIIFTLLLFDLKTQRRREAWRLLGYIPDQELLSKTEKQKLRTGGMMGTSCRNYQLALRTILASVKRVQETGIIFNLQLGSHQKKVLLRVHVAFVMGDTKSGDMLSGRYGTHMAAVPRQHRCCKCPIHELDNPDYECVFIRNYETRIPCIAAYADGFIVREHKPLVERQLEQVIERRCDLDNNLQEEADQSDISSVVGDDDSSSLEDEQDTIDNNGTKKRKQLSEGRKQVKMTNRMSGHIAKRQMIAKSNRKQSSRTQQLNKNELSRLKRERIEQSMKECMEKSISWESALMRRHQFSFLHDHHRVVHLLRVAERKPGWNANTDELPPEMARQLYRMFEIEALKLEEATGSAGCPAVNEDDDDSSVGSNWDNISGVSSLSLHGRERQAVIAKWASKHLSFLGQHKSLLAFQEIDFGGDAFGIHGCTPTDVLHFFNLGVVRYIMQLVLEKFNAEGKAIVDRLCHEIIAKQRQTERRYFPRTNFSHSLTNLTNLTGAEWVGVVFTLCVILRTDQGESAFMKSKWDVPEEYISYQTSNLGRRKQAITKDLRSEYFYDILNLLEMLLTCSAFLSLGPFWGHVVDGAWANQVRYAIKVLMETIKTRLPRQEGNGWQISKFHDFKHVVRDITRFGPPAHSDCTVGEKQLVYLAKIPAKTCQKQSYDSFSAQVASRSQIYQATTRTALDCGLDLPGKVGPGAAASDGEGVAEPIQADVEDGEEQFSDDDSSCEDDNPGRIAGGGIVQRYKLWGVTVYYQLSMGRKGGHYTIVKGGDGQVDMCPPDGVLHSIAGHIQVVIEKEIAKSSVMAATLSSTESVQCLKVEIVGYSEVIVHHAGLYSGGIAPQSLYHKRYDDIKKNGLLLRCHPNHRKDGPWYDWITMDRVEVSRQCRTLPFNIKEGRDAAEKTRMLNGCPAKLLATVSWNIDKIELGELNVVFQEREVTGGVLVYMDACLTLRNKNLPCKQSTLLFDAIILRQPQQLICVQVCPMFHYKMNRTAITERWALEFETVKATVPPAISTSARMTSKDYVNDHNDKSSWQNCRRRAVPVRMTVRERCGRDDRNNTPTPLTGTAPQQLYKPVFRCFIPSKSLIIDRVLVFTEVI